MTNKSTLAISGVALAVLVLAAVLLLSQSGTQNTNAAPGKNPSAQQAQSAKITIVRSGMAYGDMGNFPYLIISYSALGYENAGLECKFFTSKPESRVYLLDHAAIDCGDCGAFKAGLVSNFGNYGIPIKYAKPDALGAVSDSILIVPTGAYPKSVLDMESSLLAMNNTILFIGKDKDSVMASDGSVIASQSASAGWGAKSGRTPDGVEVYQGLNGGRVLYVQGTVNSFGSPSQAASRVLEIALGKDYLFALARAGIPISGRGNATIIMGNTGAGNGYIYCLAQFNGTGGAQKGSAWSVPASQKNGSLTAAQASVFPASPVQFTYLLNEDYKEPVTLKLSLSMLSKDGPVSAPMDAGTALARETAFGTINSNSPANPGDYIAVLQDQYGRELAVGALHVYNVSATALRIDDNIAQAQIEIDGRPYDGSATVWKHGSANKAVVGVSGGRLTVPVKPDGESTLVDIDVLGNVSVLEFKSQGGNIITQNPLPFAAIFGIAIAAVFYLFFRQPKKKITIVVPEDSDISGEQLDIDSAGVRAAFEGTRSHIGVKKPLPLSIDEIWRGMGRKNATGAETAFYRENVAGVLEHFERQGVISCHGGYCSMAEDVPKGTHIGELVLLRKAADALLAHGHSASFSASHMPHLRADAGGKAVCFACMESAHGTAELLKLASSCGKLVFVLSDEGKEDGWLDWLAAKLKAKQPDMSKIRIMAKNGKIAASGLAHIAGCMRGGARD